MVSQFSVARARARIKRKLKAVTEAAMPAVTPVMAASANKITSMQRHLVPVDEGDLRNSIDWTFGEPPPTKATGAFRPKPGTSKADGSVVSIYAGDDEAFYARWVEFGTQPSKTGDKVTNASGRKRKALRTHPGTAAQPYFFPAWRAHRKAAGKAMRRAIGKAVREAAKKP